MAKYSVRKQNGLFSVIELKTSSIDGVGKGSERDKRWFNVFLKFAHKSWVAPGDPKTPQDSI